MPYAGFSHCADDVSLVQKEKEKRLARKRHGIAPNPAIKALR
jgi:hypothetical protein